MKASDIIELKEYYPDYDPYTQLSALEAMVSTLRRQSLADATDIELRKTSGFYGRVHPMYGDHYVDDCANSEYFDAYLSSSFAACFAQYIEGVIRYEIQYICYLSKGVCQNIEHKRCKYLELDDFWDISIYYNVSKKRKEKNFVLGCYQLFDAIGYCHNLPENFKMNLQVLYKYRNNVMHNGVEWPKALRDKFQALETQTKPDGFVWSSSGGEPWIAHITSSYINELLVFSGELRDCF